MRRSRAYIIIGIMAMLLLASCGRQHQAKGLVKDFVKAYATEEIDINSFSDLDSTKVISDSLLQEIRLRAEKDTLFKDVKLGSIPLSTTKKASDFSEAFLYFYSFLFEGDDTRQILVEIEGSRLFESIARQLVAHTDEE